MPEPVYSMPLTYSVLTCSLNLAASEDILAHTATLHIEISVAKSKVMEVSKSLARSPSPAAVVST